MPLLHSFHGCYEHDEENYNSFTVRTLPADHLGTNRSNLVIHDTSPDDHGPPVHDLSAVADEITN